jgi:N-acetylglutamate synthase-like GNAT family acetyltransferase
MSQSIRVATVEDAANIVRLINVAFKIAEHFFVEGDRITLDEVGGSLQKGEFLVVEDDGQLTACVYLEPQQERTYLGLLSVDPTLQRAGLGTVLLGAAEKHCVKRGSQSIYMKVVNLRSELPAYYRKRGYVEQGTSPFPSHIKTKLPCWFIEMSKSLATES